MPAAFAYFSAMDAHFAHVLVVWLEHLGFCVIVDYYVTIYQFISQNNIKYCFIMPDY